MKRSLISKFISLILIVSMLGVTVVGDGQTYVRAEEVSAAEFTKEIGNVSETGNGIEDSENKGQGDVKSGKNDEKDEEPVDTDEGRDSADENGNESTGETTDVITADAVTENIDATVNTASGSTIVGFAELENSIITTAYKLTMDSLLELFPDTVTAVVADNTYISIPVTWECVDDYNLSLNEYRFIPVSDDIKWDEDIACPVITLKVQHEEYRIMGPDMEYDDDIVPVMKQPRMLKGLLNGAAPEQAYYNGYDENTLPAVRDQGSEGACWAFAGIGAAEVNLIHKGYADRSEIDLSELHQAYYLAHQLQDPKDCHNGDLIEYEGVDYVNNGGTQYMQYRSMALNVGPVEEKYAPYPKRYQTAQTPDETNSRNNYAQLMGAYRINSEDRASIKEAIREYGSVSASIYMINGNKVNPTSNGKTYTVAYDSVNGALYGNYYKTNHAILLVGWDDNFSKDKFSENLRPEEDGAWLVRNSWGLDEYGRNGYFWISYYDGSLLGQWDSVAGAYAGRVTAFNMADRAYDNVYAYDNSAASSATGYYGEVKYRQTYAVEKNESIQSVGLETYNHNNNVTVDITDKLTGDTVTVSKLCKFSGFHMLELEHPITVHDDKREYIVTVTVTNLDGDGAYIVYDRSADLDGSDARGKSIIHYTVTKESDCQEWNPDFGCWQDTTFDSKLKVYTNNETMANVKAVTLNTSGKIGLKFYLDYSKLDESLSGKEYVEIGVSGENDREKYSLDELRREPVDGIDCYIVEYPLRAREIDKTVTISAYDGSGNKVSFKNSNTDDGSYVCTIGGIAAKTRIVSSVRLADFMDSAYNYGKLTEAYFGASSDDEKTEEAAKAVSKVSSAEVIDFVKIEMGSAAGLYYYGSSLVLDTDTTLRHYFSVSDGSILDGLDCYIYDPSTMSEHKIELAKIGNQYRCDIRNISPADYGTVYELRIKKKGTGTSLYTLKYSVNSYVYDALVAADRDNSRVTLGNLAKALYKYGTAAKKYYAK